MGATSVTVSNIELSACSPFVDCSPLLGDGARLRAAAAERGYLYFRGLLPASEVQAVRRAVLQVTAAHGALDATAPLEAGVARPGVHLTEYDRTPEFAAYYRDLQRLRVFHALPHHPRLMGALEQLLGEAVWVHPRHIVHAIFPEDLKFTTPPHQDFQPVRGAPDTWTAWVPYGDCDEALGGLAVVERSHDRGWLPVGTDKETVAVGAGASWAWSPMAAGDVLLFHSLTIHQGVDNTSGDRIRLAGSFRYQRVSEPADAGALNVHLGVLDWEQVYADWAPDDPLRYYWRPLPLQIQPAWHTVAKQNGE